MSACREIRVEIQTFVDGELDRDRAQAVAVHLDRCPVCSQEATSFTALKRRLRRQRSVDLDAVARLRAFAALLSRRCPD